MVDAILLEASLRLSKKPFWADLDYRTLYLGGGTPSVLSSIELKKLVDGVCSSLDLRVSDLKEVTLEANPEDLSKTNLDGWLEAGFNRLSIGVQSFHNDTLNWMNRSHTGRQAKDGIRRARESGFARISMDLIYGAPTKRNWERDVATALELPIQHLSAYALTVEPQTVLGTQVSRQQQRMPADDAVVNDYLVLCDRMNGCGWDHYETSNWAAPSPNGSFVAQHNSAYWTGAPYLGLGPGAHGTLQKTRYANISNNPRYLESINKGVLLETQEQLSPRDLYNEAIMTGLRTSRGISPSALQSIWGRRPDQAEPTSWQLALASGSLVATPEGRFRIPESRWITGDQVAASLFWVDSV